MTHATLLTSRDQGAIAVVRVRGPRAFEVVDACFLPANGRQLTEQPLGAIRFGNWGHRSGEELLVIPRGKEEVEIHCHGGAAASSVILESMAAEGCEPTTNAKTEQQESRSPLAGDAWHALAEATTEKVAAVLLDQSNGALDHALEQVVEAIKQESYSKAKEQLEELLACYRLGAKLLDPWKVVIVGEPNVGKSSLINALLGYDRALVYDQPGVTRDVVTANTAIHGWPVRLFDTAGIREADDPLEAGGIELAKQTLNLADIVVLVREAGSMEENLHKSLELPIDTQVIQVLSKADLLEESPQDSNLIPTSTVGPPGMEGLIQSLEARLSPIKLPQGTAVPFRELHAEAIKQAIKCLETSKPQEAMSSLQALLAGQVEFAD